MDARIALGELLKTIDERRWDALGDYLHAEFRCRYVHTGEVLDGPGWIRLNAEYPGFDRLRVEQLVGDAEAAAARSHITGHGDHGLMHFECATFVVMQDGQIREMTEVWTDVDQQPPAGTRPGTEPA